jgi:lipoic acid synthetase
MSESPRKPEWLRRRLPAPGHHADVSAVIRKNALHTVCAEAQCPNQMECFGKGTATFLLLGASCTRRCRFCAVDKSPVLPPDPDEPAHTADAVKKMGLKFCVLTMVTRDDLPDGGAELIARTIEAVRENLVREWAWKCSFPIWADIGRDWREF